MYFSDIFIFRTERERGLIRLKYSKEALILTYTVNICLCWQPEAEGSWFVGSVILDAAISQFLKDTNIDLQIIQVEPLNKSELVSGNIINFNNNITSDLLENCNFWYSLGCQCSTFYNQNPAYTWNRKEFETPFNIEKSFNGPI